MWNYLCKDWISLPLAMLIYAGVTSSGVAQSEKHLFDLLPTEVQKQIVDGRNACKEALGTERLSLEDGLQTIWAEGTTFIVGLGHSNLYGSSHRRLQQPRLHSPNFCKTGYRLMEIGI